MKLLTRPPQRALRLSTAMERSRESRSVKPGLQLILRRLLISIPAQKLSTSKLSLPPQLVSRQPISLPASGLPGRRSPARTLTLFSATARRSRLSETGLSSPTRTKKPIPTGQNMSTRSSPAPLLPAGARTQRALRSTGWTGRQSVP